MKAIGIAALIVGAALAPAAAISALPARGQGTASVEDAYALPDPTMTPGAIDPLATLDVICNRTTKERRHVSAATKADVLAAYNIPAADSASYEIDHLIPLALGGANAAANLWPQPWARSRSEGHPRGRDAAARVRCLPHFDARGCRRGADAGAARDRRGLANGLRPLCPANYAASDTSCCGPNDDQKVKGGS